MRKSINIRGMKLGEGRPKVCVPITGKSEADILKEAKLAQDAGADLVEWRADYYEDVHKSGKAAEMAVKLRETAGEMPVLFTYRTEGGENPISLEEYISLNKSIAAGKAADLIDIELFMGDEVCQEFCEYAHQNGCVVVISSHDFERTPNDQTIVERMCKMHELGGDVPKVAVMPHNAEDVLTLLSATNQYANVHADGPLITMAMGWLGGVSRISGEIFGSSLTFGSTLRSSAPGQLSIKEVNYILDALHKEETEG